MAHLPLAAMEHLLREEGAIRISEGAKQALRKALERHLDGVGKLAVQFARHAQRKTITEEDVKLALQQKA